MNALSFRRRPFCSRSAPLESCALAIRSASSDNVGIKRKVKVSIMAISCVGTPIRPKGAKIRSIPAEKSIGVVTIISKAEKRTSKSMRVPICHACKTPSCVICTEPSEKIGVPGVKNRCNADVKRSKNKIGLPDFPTVLRGIFPTRASTRRSAPQKNALSTCGVANIPVRSRTIDMILQRGSSLCRMLCPGMYWPNIRWFENCMSAACPPAILLVPLSPMLRRA